MTLENNPAYRALHGESTQGMIAVYHRPSGDIWVSLNAAPVQSKDGQRIGAVTSVHDITLQHRAEEALRQSEARFRSMFEHSMDAIFLTMPSGRVLAANPAARSLFGMTEEELDSWRPARPGRSIRRTP